MSSAPQLMEQQAHPHHIRHSIQRPHLVEMHLGDGFSVGPALGLRNGLIDRLGLSLDRIRQRQVGDHMGDVRQAGMVVMGVGMVMVMVMGMDMRVLLLAVDPYVHMST